MITVKKAQDLILKNAKHTGVEELSLKSSHGRILAENIISPVSHPLFNQSAVDGYAFRHRDVINIKGMSANLRLAGELKAGDFPDIKINKGETIRIFTGAPLPLGADTVVMQEFINQNGSLVFIKKKSLKKGSNVRKKGGQIRKGRISLEKGTMLNHAGIGFLASLGIKYVKVFRKPKVTIMVTGNEFATSTKNFKTGKIYESNGIMLQSALRESGINAPYNLIRDDKKILKAALLKSLRVNEIIIITGGVSVGKYDFTKAVIEEIGFETVFHKVAQKPGKPILFAKKTGNKSLKNNKFIFGLPGNPRSAMICFYEYVFPFIIKSMGSSTPFLRSILLPLSAKHEKRDDKLHFLASKFVDDKITILSEQASHMLQSLSIADALVVIPENKKIIHKDELVEVHLLPKK